MADDALASAAPRAALEQPFLTFPDHLPGPGQPGIVTSDSQELSAQTWAFTIREHDLERWLAARAGDGPEKFWSPEYINHHGRTFCDEVLRLIVLLNVEEVGSLGFRWMNEAILWSPQEFSLQMSGDRGVDDMFAPDQVEQYGRPLLTKAVEWCKYQYEQYKSTWDSWRDDPPAGPYREALQKNVESSNNPQTLKVMGIVPMNRPDAWPFEVLQQLRAGRTGQSKPKSNGVHITTRSDRYSSDSNPQGPGGEKANGNAHGGQTNGEMSNGDERGEVPDKPASVPDAQEDESSNEPDLKNVLREGHLPVSRAPSSPRGKKSAPAKIEDEPQAVGRRFESDPENSARDPRHEKLAREDWLTAPGAERRAVSTESQAQLMYTKTAAAQPNKIPACNRGRVQPPGRFYFKEGEPLPPLHHSYPSDAIMQNNFVYAYHQQHSQRNNIGQRRPPRAEYDTTYNPRMTSLRTDPRTVNMFSPVNQVRSPVHNFMSPHTPRAGAGHTVLMAPGMRHENRTRFASPSVASAAPFYPQHLGNPHMGLAETVRMVSQHQAPPGFVPNTAFDIRSLQFVDAVPLPGHQYPHGQTQYAAHFGNNYTPIMVQHTSRHHQPGSSNSRPGPRAGHQAYGTAGNSIRGGRNFRREAMRTDPTPFSENTGFVPYPMPGASYPFSPSGPPSLAPSGGQALPPSYASRRGTMSSNAEPFPHYATDRGETVGWATGERCTPTTVGPDAEDVVSLWFGDIPRESTVEELQKFIEDVVPVRSIRSPLRSDFSTGRSSRAWTFVEFFSNSDCRRALAQLNGAEFKGLRLRVNVPGWRCGLGPRTRRSSSYARPSTVVVNSPLVHQQYKDEAPTPGRGARKSSSGSLSRASHAVRRNSTYTQQDARSDLPLAGLPEGAEDTKVVAEAEAEPRVKPGMSNLPVAKGRKKAPRKSKTGSRSRTASVAPTDSRPPSGAENGDRPHQPLSAAAPPSRTYASALNTENKKTDLRIDELIADDPNPSHNDIKKSNNTSFADAAAGNLAADPPAAKPVADQKAAPLVIKPSHENPSESTIVDPHITAEDSAKGTIPNGRDLSEAELNGPDDASAGGDNINQKASAADVDKDVLESRQQKDKKQKGPSYTESMFPSSKANMKKTKEQEKQARKKEKKRQASQALTAATASSKRLEPEIKSADELRAEARKGKSPKAPSECSDATAKGATKTAESTQSARSIDMDDGAAVTSSQHGTSSRPPPIKRHTSASSSLPDTPITAREFQTPESETATPQALPPSQSSSYLGEASASLEENRKTADTALGPEVAAGNRPRKKKSGRSASKQSNSSVAGSHDIEAGASNQESDSGQAPVTPRGSSILEGKSAPHPESVAPLPLNPGKEADEAYSAQHSGSSSQDIGAKHGGEVKGHMSYAQAAKNKVASKTADVGLSERNVNVPQ